MNDSTLHTSEERAGLTVLGLGPMGQALARAFLRRGHRTTVWNRTASKADQLVAEGATRAANVEHAIAASPLVIVCVVNYDVVRALLQAAADHLRGRTLVNLTAGSPDQARSMAEWASRHRIEYLDGAILTPAYSIGTPSAVVFYSGPEAVYRVQEQTLTALGGSARYFGSDLGRAAAYELALLDLFWMTMSGCVHAFAIARAEQINAADIAPYMQGIVNLMPDIIGTLAGDVDAGRYPGTTSNILSAASAMTHIIEAADARGLDTELLRAAKATTKRAIEAGFGEEGFSRLTAMLLDEAHRTRQHPPR